MIIPFFIPHAGCPHQCVFCNQKKITGRTETAPSDLTVCIRRYLDTAPSAPPHQVAFYGGTFTALPIALQKEYLKLTQPFIHAGFVKSIRLSTRPDAITREILDLLRAYTVETVELGVQSMNDRVLSLSGRGHSASDTASAVDVLKDYGFKIGLQLMPGLPGDSRQTFLSTMGQTIALKPDFVRLYPALVIRDTPLESLYHAGQFTPLSLDDAVSLCRHALIQFEDAGIDVIRIGLQPTEELERAGTIVAGPYHPAFRQLVESSIMLDRIRAVLAGAGAGTNSVQVMVNPADLSSAIGQKRSNIAALRKEFGRDIRIRADSGVPRRGLKLHW